MRSQVRILSGALFPRGARTVNYGAPEPSADTTRVCKGVPKQGHRIRKKGRPASSADRPFSALLHGFPRNRVTQRDVQPIGTTSCWARRRAPIRPTPSPTTLRAVPFSSTSLCPPTSTTDSGALHTPPLVLGPRSPSAHGFGSSDHPLFSPRLIPSPSPTRESSHRLPPLDVQPTMPFGPIGRVGLPSMGLAVKTHAAYTPEHQVLAAGVRVR